MIVLRRSKSEKFCAESSKIIEEKLVKTKEFVKAKSIMFYAAKTDEVRTKSMIKIALNLGKRIIIPVVNK